MACARLPGEPCFRKIPDAPSFNATADSDADMPAVTISTLPWYPAAPRAGDELAAVVVPQVEIQQHHVHRRPLQQIQRFGQGSAMARHLEIRFRGEQPAQAFAEEHVVVKQ